MCALKQNKLSDNRFGLESIEACAEKNAEHDTPINQHGWCVCLDDKKHQAPAISSADTFGILDIVNDLQKSYQASAANRILKQIEFVLGISNIAMGLFDATNNQSLIAVGDHRPYKLANNHFACQRCSMLPRQQGDRFEAIFDFGQTAKAPKVVGYFAFDATDELTHKQKQLIQLLTPYLYSYLHSLHFIANGFKRFKLTSREKEVIEWMKEGKDNWAISKILGISERTIKFHNCNIFKKLGVNSRNEVICWYYQFFSSVGAMVEKKNREMRSQLIFQ